VADAVWDATRADHGDAGTFGEVLQGFDGTADGATEDTIDLGANAPVADVTGQGVRIVAGAGAGQARRIVAYADGVATVSPAWDDEPDDTSRWVLTGIVPGGLDAGAVADAVWDATRADHGDAGTFGEVLQGFDGTADGATEDTIDLGANAPVADVTGQGVRIVAGAGAGQARRIVAYADGVATVSPAWDDEPDDTSRWVLTGIVPGGPVDLADDAITPAKLADGAITEAKIADGAITGPKIADGAFTSAKVGLGTVNAAATGFLERLRKLMDALVPVGLGGVTQPRSGAGSRVVKNPDGTTQATYPVDTEAAGGTQTLGPGA
jgi:hypothetical protein